MKEKLSDKKAKDKVHSEIVDLNAKIASFLLTKKKHVDEMRHLVY